MHTEETPSSLPYTLVVIAKDKMNLDASREHAFLVKDEKLPSFTSLLREKNVTIRPLFNIQPTTNIFSPSLEEKEETERRLVHEMVHSYYTEGPKEQMYQLAEQLQTHPLVKAAYVKPPAVPAVFSPQSLRSTEEVPIATPDFTSRQGYLNAAPEGVDAHYAWKFEGGDGKGVTVIDCEWSWNLKHEDLHNKSVVIGTDSNMYRDHGTAVLGVFNGDKNGYGVTGIAHGAKVGCAAFGPTSQTIQQAADKLERGDIILLEIHRPGPNAKNGSGQFGFIAIEWWPDDYLAIRYATTKGVIVVEAAGNGYQNLNDDIYNIALPGFPSNWKNPFNLNNNQSGAVIVGAGEPPSGTHGRTGYTDRARCEFSNHGDRVDCQGWGWEVTTTGYGYFQGGNDENRWYTDTFSGTSSASPIIVGTIACLQGILKARSKHLLDSTQIVKLLRETGSAQLSAPDRPNTQRIGNRPNLLELISKLI